MAACGSPTDASSPSGATSPAAPVFNATTEGDGNVVNISASGDTVVVDVQSASGIGTATVDLVSGTAPTNIVVRLHLRGLEAFRLSFDQTVIAASVASDERHSVSQQIEQPDGDAHPIASDGPLWLDMEIDSTPASPATLSQPGSFAIRMPPELMNEQRRSFTIRWIDFYR